MIKQQVMVDPAGEDKVWALHKGLDSEDLKTQSRHNRVVRFEQNKRWPNYLPAEYEYGSGAEKRLRPTLGPEHVDQTAE